MFGGRPFELILASMRLGPLLEEVANETRQRSGREIQVDVI